MIVEKSKASVASAVLSVTTPVQKYPMQLCGVYLHSTAGLTDTLSTTKNMIDRNGTIDAGYSTVLEAASLSAATDHVFRPSGKEIILPGETINVTHASTETATVGITIVCQGVRYE